MFEWTVFIVEARAGAEGLLKRKECRGVERAVRREIKNQTPGFHLEPLINGMTG